MIRWLSRLVIALLVIFILLYGGDLAVFRARGAPISSVTVSRILSVPLKGGKQELDYQGSYPVPCSVSLFPQGGFDSCWYLRRNSNQSTKL